MRGSRQGFVWRCDTSAQDSQILVKIESIGRPERTGGTPLRQHRYQGRARALSVERSWLMLWFFGDFHAGSTREAALTAAPDGAPPKIR